MLDFATFVFTPAGAKDCSLAIAACRAGAIGVYDAEFDEQFDVVESALKQVAAHVDRAFGVRTERLDEEALALAERLVVKGLGWLIASETSIRQNLAAVARLRRLGIHVVGETVHPRWQGSPLDGLLDGLLLKGNEAGGHVGEEAGFILVQAWRGRTQLPLFLRGGLTPHVAAACAAVGVAGGVLDSQLLLLDEAHLPSVIHPVLGALSGSETVAVGSAESGQYFRALVRPSLAAARGFVVRAEGMKRAELEQAIKGKQRWDEPARAVLPIGQDVAFAALWRKRYGHIGAVLRAVDDAVAGHCGKALDGAATGQDAPLAHALGVRFPIVQGPMTRVSDCAEFARDVAEAGALPMVAFALLKGRPLEDLLTRTQELLGSNPWGIGLLGFAPQSLLDEQLAIAVRFKPRYAIIAGGRPDQAVHLERAGISTFLHVPASGLIPGFLHEGARRFIFEGRECGGHIGPLSSFVLWSSMVDRLQEELATGRVSPGEVQVLFAGGIHDAVSSAMVQVIAAPLTALGVRIGVLMGSAYLFTRQIVDSGAIVPRFQQEVLDCEQTVNLESGPGHASRCAYTPFARDFFAKRASMRQEGVPADESRRVLDDLILGRLRIASKGSKREGLNAPLQLLDEGAQHAQGMYMLGQLVVLRRDVIDIGALHADVTEGALALLEGAASAAPAAVPPGGAAADVAIVGLATVVPKANDARVFWENILAGVDAITEIPSHRWDWRLYFDPDRQAKDKIYSRWGGFLDDLPFDPTQYGMPPKSIESVDPMQLMGLEVARRTLVDSGYHERPFDRERASVILGASGGAGDYGLMYGLRSELPRFSGQLPAEVAARLPTWTEDSFAGILPNVVAGRIANRLNFGGINMAVDAACASSLAAIYQGVSELLAGRSDFVIAGGVDTVQGPFGYLCFSKTQALSPRGRCHTFDADGDGIAISEGIAMVALKRLADAVRDGDRIYAVIKGIGASSDGNAKGLTAPLPAGQLRAMRRAYSQAGFGPASVGLFEAHGTGTVAGDTAELESTTRLIREERGVARSAVIGSVKTNIGHTKATAGVAGLIKAALAIHHRVLPPHRNVTTPNAVLRDPTAPLYLLDKPRPWIASGSAPRRAAASAFGFGGTNFHVVLEEYGGEYRPWLRPASSTDWPAELFVWSDETTEGLAGKLDALRAALAEAPEVMLRDLAASLASRWTRQAQCLTIVSRSVDELSSRLATAADRLRKTGEGPWPAGIAHGQGTASAGKVAVVFPGQGSQYPEMLREAALHFDVVAQTLCEADACLEQAFEERFGPGRPLSSFLLPRGAYDVQSLEAAREQLTRTDVAQPALGAVEVALLRQLQELGLRPHMYAGHSYGELVGLHAAGAFDFQSLMNLSAGRGRFIVDAAAASGAELGTMAAASGPRKAIEESIADIDGVIIANHNAPQQSIVSGTRDGVAEAIRRLTAAGVEATAIPVAAAFHSRLVEPAQRPLADLIEATPWKPVSIPVYSNTTARPHAVEPQRVKRQLGEHLVRPVEWVSEVEAMYNDGARVFIEVGPKAVLTRLCARILSGRPHVAIALDEGSGLAGLLAGLGQMLCAGLELDLAQLFERRECRSGDPADPASLVRRSTLGKHAWLLNGSGPRRAGDTRRQVGVTLEQARAGAETPPPAVTAPTTASATLVAPVEPLVSASADARALQSDISRKDPTPKVNWRKGPRMDERRTSPGLADGGVMSEYFATMRQFLETQERVMAAFLGDGMPSRPAMRPRPLAAPALPRALEMPAAMPAPAVVVAPAQVTPVPPAPAVAVAPAPAASAPVPRIAVPPAPAPAAAAQAPAAATLTRERLVEMVLAIVEEKTGYPKDMVGLSQNLEADLGIDSIKRIEVVGALLQQIPAELRDALTESRSKLNTQQTLDGMLDLVMAAKPAGKVAVPFDQAGVGEPAGGQRQAALHPPRQIMQAQPEAIPGDARRRQLTGLVLLAGGSGELQEALAQALTGQGCSLVRLGANDLCEEALLVERMRQGVGEQQLSAIIHLGGAAGVSIDASSTAAQWRAGLQAQDKSLYLVLRELGAKVVAGGLVMAVSDLGGRYGRHGDAGSSLRVVGGGVGMVKSLREERGDLRVKAVDLDPARPVSEHVAELLVEAEVVGGRIEVGYPAGERTVFLTVEQSIVQDPARDAAVRDLVVIATGGARGVTAEVLRELARPGNTLILTGRSRWPEPEPQELAACGDAQALRSHFVAQVRAGSLQLTPAEIQRRVQGVLDQREMRANVEDLRGGGADVEYVAVDVTDTAAVEELVRSVRERHGRVDGVVHGAGVIEDKLIADKRSDSWSRVVDTKVIGLLALRRALGDQPPKFLVVFSSVAGRYGNSGQSDYATANELMNRLCQSFQVEWGGRTMVSAMCWGPWGPTKFGAGMVNAQTEAKFAEKGVRLVTADLGRRLFRQELGRSGEQPVEVVFGPAPWDSREREIGAFERDLAASKGPLIGAAEVRAQPTGEQVLDIVLDPAVHLYLQEHALDGRMVLPAAAALELMAESVQSLWPGWKVVEVKEHRLLKGLDTAGEIRALQVVVSPPPYGSAEGFEVTVTLRSEGAAGRVQPHYRNVVRLAQAFDAADKLPLRRFPNHSLTVAQAYGEWLFHGPRFQVIEAVEGLARDGGLVAVRSTLPAQWLSAACKRDGTWLFDPGLVDAAAQMAWLWSRAFRDESALPSRFTRVIRHCEHLPQRLHMEFVRAEADDAKLVRGDFRFCDPDGTPVMTIEGLESIGSAALNRLGGTARVAVDAAL